MIKTIAHHFFTFDELLAKAITDDGLIHAEIEDVVTGRVYPAVHRLSKVKPCGEGQWSLHQYLFAKHWCGCHRVTSIEDAGGSVENPGDCDCPTDRFIVRRAWHASRPDFVLMREAVVQMTGGAMPQTEITAPTISSPP